MRKRSVLNLRGGLTSRKAASMGVVIAIVVIAAVIGGGFWFARGRTGVSEELKGQIDATKAARKAWRGAVKTRDFELKAANETLTNLTSQKGQQLAAFGGATVYQRWIDTPQGGGSIIGVKAEAADETSIQKRITATRLLTIGVFAFVAKKKTGGGNVYVVIEGPSISGLATMAGDKDSNNGPKAFAFAAKVNNAARAAESAEPSRGKAIEAQKSVIVNLERADAVRSAAATYASAAALLPSGELARFPDVP